MVRRLLRAHEDVAANQSVRSASVAVNVATNNVRAKLPMVPRFQE